MIRKSLIISGLAIVALPAGLRAQLYVASGASLHIATGGVVAVAGGNVTALDNVTGDGQLILNGTTGQTLTGVAGKSISPSVVIKNAANVNIGGLTRLAGPLEFQTGAVLLGANNLAFTSAAVAAVTGADAATNRYIVTNGAGVVTKEGLPAASSFTFPVGRSNSAGDYNQAIVTNTGGAARDFSVQVKNKAESGVTSGNATKGVDRFWSVTSNAAGTATVALQHKSGEQGSAFNDAQGFVTQQTSAANWDVSSQIGAAGAAITHTRTGLPIATVASVGGSNWLSKSNDPINSITPNIQVSPIALLQGAWDGISAMTTTLNSSTILQNQASVQPYSAAPFNYAGTESVGTGFFAANPTITDWVLVELRDATTPATIVARRAAFIKNNGQIVDIDGLSPVSFKSIATGSYHISVLHRNHLPIRTAGAQAFAESVATVYDFTSGQSQAYQDPAYAANNAAQAILTGTPAKTGLWAGNANSNSTVRYSGPGNDPNYILSTTLGGNTLLILNNQYSSSDINMNGSVRYSGPGNEINFFLTSILQGNTLKIINQHL